MLLRLLIPIVIASSCCHAAPSSGGSIDQPNVSDVLIEWLRANGAYINEKLEVKHVVPNDPSSPRGVFATKDMDIGETLCSIPSPLILKPRKELIEGLPSDYEDCGAANAVMEAISGDEITPYGQYLLQQPNGYIPSFWSEAGKDLLVEMLKSKSSEPLTASPTGLDHDELPPHGVQLFLDGWEKWCGGDIDNQLYVKAVMLREARADYKYMIPFYDMFNHSNKKYNMEHKYDYYKNHDQIEQTGAVFVTTQPIKAGGEVYNSYNRCNICQEAFDWHGTPEMFAQFGFVEALPQRWLFDFARVKFDLDWKGGDETSGEIVVNFLVPPSKKGMVLLQGELDRLKTFSTIHRSNTYNDYDGMSKYEWEKLWEYYNALYAALSNAIGQGNAAALSDEVWKLGDNWWVKDGELEASQSDEHWVRPTVNYVHPTQSDEVLNDEL